MYPMNIHPMSVCFPPLKVSKILYWLQCEEIWNCIDYPGSVEGIPKSSGRSVGVPVPVWNTKHFFRISVSKIVVYESDGLFVRWKPSGYEAKCGYYYGRCSNSSNPNFRYGNRWGVSRMLVSVPFSEKYCIFLKMRLTKSGTKLNLFQPEIAWIIWVL